MVKEVGEGSFGTVVLAVNKRNHVGAWTDRRVKRKVLQKRPSIRVKET